MNIGYKVFCNAVSIYKEVGKFIYEIDIFNDAKTNYTITINPKYSNWTLKQVKKAEDKKEYHYMSMLKYYDENMLIIYKEYMIHRSRMLDIIINER